MMTTTQLFAAKISRETFLERSPAPFLLLVTPLSKLMWHTPTNTTVQTDRRFFELAGTELSPRDRLVWEVLPSPGSMFPGRVHIGRTARSDIQIPHHTISRLHCYFDRDDDSGQYFLTDNGSRNGTRVGERRLLPSQRVKVDVGTFITVGPIQLVFADAAHVYRIVHGVTGLENTTQQLAS